MGIESRGEEKEAVKRKPLFASERFAVGKGAFHRANESEALRKSRRRKAIGRTN